MSNKKYILQDGTIGLRHFSIYDKQRLSELANNDKISGNLRDNFPFPYSLKHAQDFIEMALSQDPISIFAIEENGEYVGNIGLHPSTDVYRESAEIGYFIGEPYWNRGIATRAIKLMLGFGFNEMDLSRIHAGVFEFNPASGRVLEKAGFEREGLFRKAIIKNGKLYDELRYSILKDEFNEK